MCSFKVHYTFFQFIFLSQGPEHVGRNERVAGLNAWGPISYSLFVRAVSDIITWLAGTRDGNDAQ